MTPAARAVRHIETRCSPRAAIPGPLHLESSAECRKSGLGCPQNSDDGHRVSGKLRRRKPLEIAARKAGCQSPKFCSAGARRAKRFSGLTFAYDTTGNRTFDTTTAGGATTTKSYLYPATNNKLSSETINGTLARSRPYDGAGNMLAGLPVGASYSVVTNNRGTPQGLKLNGTNVATYLFNALEQMAGRTLVSPLTPAGVTHFIYDTGGHLIAEATGTTAVAAVITREYIWLGDMPVMVVDGANLAGTGTPTLSAVHVDHLMRPVRLTNAAKAAVWDATWLPWGGAHVTTGTAAMNLRFPGQYFLIEQGLAYNWHRMYDQTTARYTQPDPLGFPDGPARYAYALNNPLMYTDEEGRFINFLVGAGLGAGIDLLSQLGRVVI